MIFFRKDRVVTTFGITKPDVSPGNRIEVVISGHGLKCSDVAHQRVMTARNGVPGQSCDPQEFIMCEVMSQCQNEAPVSRGTCCYKYDCHTTECYVRFLIEYDDQVEICDIDVYEVDMK